jgi:hypothetical protein
MSDFRTIVRPFPIAQQIALTDPILTIGSCFSDAIGIRLKRAKLAVLSNPFGTLYSPLAILKALRYALFNERPPRHTYLLQGDVSLNYDFHSEVSAIGTDTLQSQLNEITGASHYFLTRANWLIVTFGTAWVYLRKDTGEAVANCHKVPQSNFTKALLTVDEITASVTQFIDELRAVNKDIKLILTVSPVRHVKDSLTLNNVSKSTLRLACHKLSQAVDAVEYFPAFEIMMDDLRDYRFYKADLIHPSEVAEEYIWDSFVACYCDEPLSQFMKEWDQIRRAIDHHPFHPASAAHQSFLNQTLLRLEALQPLVNVEAEIKFIQTQIIS